MTDSNNILSFRVDVLGKEYNVVLLGASSAAVSVDVLRAFCGVEITMLQQGTTQLYPEAGIFSGIRSGEFYVATVAGQTPAPAAAPVAAAAAAAPAPNPNPPTPAAANNGQPPVVTARRGGAVPGYLKNRANQPTVAQPVEQQQQYTESVESYPPQEQQNDYYNSQQQPEMSQQTEQYGNISPSSESSSSSTYPVSHSPSSSYGGGFTPSPTSTYPVSHSPSSSYGGGFTPAQSGGGGGASTRPPPANKKNKKKNLLYLTLDGDVSVPPPLEQQPEQHPESSSSSGTPSSPYGTSLPEPSSSSSPVPVPTPQAVQSPASNTPSQSHSFTGFIKKFVKKGPSSQEPPKASPLGRSPSDTSISSADEGESSSSTNYGNESRSERADSQTQSDQPEQPVQQSEQQSGNSEGGDSGIQFLAPNPGSENTMAQVLADFGDMPEDKNERLRLKCVREIMITEEVYVSDLEMLERVFMIPIKFQNVLTADQYQKLFSNAEMLKPIHIELLQALGDKDKTQGGKYVGGAFLSLCQYMKMYSVYCANHDNAVALLEELKLNKDFAHTLMVCETDPLAKGQNLASFLIKPVQRVCKYPLFFRELLTYTPEDHPDYEKLQEAKGKIDEVVAFINEGKRKFEEQQKMIQILASIDGEWQEELITPTRFLVSETRISGRQKITSGGLLQPVHDHMLYVFNDLIVICRCIIAVGHNKPYILRATMPMYCVQPVVIADNEKVRNSFEIVFKNPVTNTVETTGGFQFFAKTSQEKDALVKSIRSLSKEAISKLYSLKNQKTKNLISLVPEGGMEGQDSVTPPPAAVAAAAAGNDLSIANSAVLAQSMSQRNLGARSQIQSRMISPQVAASFSSQPPVVVTPKEVAPPQEPQPQQQQQPAQTYQQPTPTEEQPHEQQYSEVPSASQEITEDQLRRAPPPPVKVGGVNLSAAKPPTTPVREAPAPPPGAHQENQGMFSPRTGNPIRHAPLPPPGADSGVKSLPPSPINAENNQSAAPSKPVPSAGGPGGITPMRHAPAPPPAGVQGGARPLPPPSRGPPQQQGGGVRPLPPSRGPQQPGQRQHCESLVGTPGSPKAPLSSPPNRQLPTPRSNTISGPAVGSPKASPIVVPQIQSPTTTMASSPPPSSSLPSLPTLSSLPPPPSMTQFPPTELPSSSSSTAPPPATNTTVPPPSSIGGGNDSAAKPTIGRIKSPFLQQK